MTQWNGLTADEKDQFVDSLVVYGTEFVAPLYAVVENIEKALMEKNRAQADAAPVATTLRNQVLCWLPGAPKLAEGTDLFTHPSLPAAQADAGPSASARKALQYALAELGKPPFGGVVDCTPILQALIDVGAEPSPSVPAAQGLSDEQLLTASKDADEDFAVGSMPWKRSFARAILANAARSQALDELVAESERLGGYDLTAATVAESSEEAASYERMFEDAVRSLAAVDAVLGIDPDEAGGSAPILEAIAALKTKAAVATAALPDELKGIPEAVSEGGGSWRTCTGCYESEDGHPVGHYPYSKVLDCALGGGCSECGGIGAVWDTTDYAAMADDGWAQMQRQQAAQQQAEPVWTDDMIRRVKESADALREKIKPGKQDAEPVVNVAELTEELYRAHVLKVLADVEGIARDRTDAHWAGFQNAIEEVRTRLDMPAEQQADPEADALAVARERGAKTEEPAAARAWIVAHRPALTLSRQSTIDAYMQTLRVFDALVAQAEHVGRHVGIAPEPVGIRQAEPMAFTDCQARPSPSIGAVVGERPTAKQIYDECEGDKNEPDPIERLRFFCSLAMSGQDWLDVEPFFDAIIAAKAEPALIAQGGVSPAFKLADRIVKAIVEDMKPESGGCDLSAGLFGPHFSALIREIAK